MKVALVGPVYPYRGGIAHYTALLDRALRAQGHTSLVFSFKRQYPSWLYPGASDKDPSQQTLRTDARYILDPLYPWTWYQAARAIHQADPDLVAVQWWTTFWGLPFALLGKALRAYGLHLVYMIHNVLPHEKRPGDIWLARAALQQGQAFVAQTQREKDRLMNLLPMARVEVCPLPPFDLLDRARYTKAEARKSLGLPVDEPVMLFFGIVRPYKGLAVLLDALGRLKIEGYQPQLYIAGEFWQDKSMYLEQIEQLGLGEQVKIDDRYVPNEQVQVIFAAADVLVAPYTGGTQSAAAGMALGFGLPLIVTEQVAVGLSSEAIEHALVVPSNDPAALSGTIRGYLQNPQILTPPPPSDQTGWDSLVETLVRLQQLVSRRKS